MVCGRHSGLLPENPTLHQWFIARIPNFIEYTLTSALRGNEKTSIVLNSFFWVAYAGLVRALPVFCLSVSPLVTMLTLPRQPHPRSRPLSALPHYLPNLRMMVLPLQLETIR